MKSFHLLALLCALLAGGCPASNDDDATGDDDDATGDDDDATGDDDDATGDDDDVTGDDDDATDPIPSDLGVFESALLVGFSGPVPDAMRVLTSDDVGGATTFVSGTLTDASGATVGQVSASSDGVVALSWSNASHDWRSENPIELDLTLTVETDSGPQTAIAQWQIAALPAETVLSWGDAGGWALLPSALAPRASAGIGFGGTGFSPGSEPQSGLWSLGSDPKPTYYQLSELCTTAGSGGLEACFSAFATSFQGAVETEVTASTMDGQDAQIRLIEPYDWDEDGDIDEDDLLAWDAGTAPCRGLTVSNATVPLLIGASEHVLTGPIPMEQDGRAATGALVDAFSATTYTYDDSTGSYAPGAAITGAAVVNAGDGLFTLELPAAAFDFRVTNPATVHVEWMATDAGGRCFEGTHLVTVGAAPESTAIAWIGGTGYLGTGAVVAPRPGNALYFDNYSVYFGATNEVETGIWELGATSQPAFAAMDLLYYSAGARYATSYNESLISSFNQLSSSPLILEGSVLGTGVAEVHFPTLTDLDGDGSVTPSDLRVYLNAL